MTPRHGPCRKRSLPQLIHCCLRVCLSYHVIPKDHCAATAFISEQLPSNGCLWWLHNFALSKYATIPFNIILQSTTLSPKWSISFGFSGQISYAFRMWRMGGARYISSSSSPPFYDIDHGAPHDVIFSAFLLLPFPYVQALFPAQGKQRMQNTKYIRVCRLNSIEGPTHFSFFLLETEISHFLVSSADCVHTCFLFGILNSCKSSSKPDLGVSGGLGSSDRSDHLYCGIIAATVWV